MKQSTSDSKFDRNPFNIFGGKSSRFRSRHVFRYSRSLSESCAKITQRKRSHIIRN
jgi:hypothetical protein